MYSGVYYDANSDQMYMFTHDENGDREHVVTSYVPYFYSETKDTEGDALSLRGHPVKRIDSESFYKYHGKKKNFRDQGYKTFEGDMSPEVQFLVDKYLETDLTEKENTLNYVHLDIECEVDGGMPDAHDPDQRINLITMYSEKHSKFFTLGLHESNEDRKNVEYICCENEKDLLNKFIEVIEYLKPDIITGWNVDGFDIPYILNRIESLLGEEKKNSISPIGLPIKSRKTKGRYGKEEFQYTIPGLNVVDYMDIYRNFSQGDRESYSLDYISQYELEEGKIDFDDSYKNLYKKNWERFVDYNIQDVKLVRELENKLGYLNLTISIAWTCKIPIQYVQTTIKKVDAVITTYLKREGVVMDDEFLDCDQEKYPGGYVLESDTGIFEWVSCLDISSLYPSVMRQFNISPETFVFCIPEDVAINKLEGRDVDKHHIPVKKGNEKRERKTSKVFEYIRKNDLILTPNGSVYKSKKQREGVIPRILTDLYTNRMETKKRMSEKDGDVSKLDAKQYALKILMNSIYGYLGTPYCRFYNPDMAGSVTVAGRYYTKGCINRLNEYFEKQDERLRKKLGLPEGNGKNIVKAADTDSVFLHLGRYVDDDLTDEKAMKVVNKLNNLACKKANDIAEDITDQFDLENYIKFDKEYVARYVSYLTKKRYVYSKIDTENFGDEDNFDISAKGFEIVKSSTPYQVREYLKDVCRTILKTQNESDVHDKIKEIYDDFLELDPVEIAFPTSVNGIQKYTSESGGCKKGTPIHVRGAIVWNNLLEKNDIEDYEPIVEGGKMRYVYLKQNHITTSHVIGFGDVGLPSSLGLDRYVDYDKMFQKTFMKPMDPFFEILGWDRPNLKVKDLSSIFS